MGLLDNNGGTLAMLLKFMGIRDLQGACSDPDAVIELNFTRYDQQHTVKFTCGEFLDGLHKHTLTKPDEPPPGYQDVTDLPDG